jgi:hypothetical protein
MTRFAVAALAAIALTGCADPLDRQLLPYTGTVKVMVIDYHWVSDDGLTRLTKDGWRLAAETPRSPYIVLIKE